MYQERIWRDSRSLPKRFHISWISNQHWSNWRSLHPDGQGRAEGFHLSNDGRWVLSIQKRIGGSHSINLEKLDRREIVLTSTKRWVPSSPRVRRRATRADSFLAIPAMASIVFFIQHILVAVERFLVELVIINKKSPQMSSCM